MPLPFLPLGEQPASPPPGTRTSVRHRDLEPVIRGRRLASKRMHLRDQSAPAV
ncbi:hypothetical protein [Streptomyces mashuensis]|nr:hypothetical protein [Streptomyces mashuensis]